MMHGAVPNILAAVGNTPLVKLERVAADVAADVYVKCEYLNPGGSMKDRMALHMIGGAEQRGELEPGGTIIEATSGNTGAALAMIAAVRGYKCIFVMPDKMSIEKIASLRAFGARVVVCPTAVEPDDPRSYYSVAERLAEGDAEQLLREPVPQPGQPGRPLRLDGARAMGADEGRDRRLRRRPRHGRHHHRHRALSQGEEADRSSSSASIRSARSTTTSSRPGA